MEVIYTSEKPKFAIAKDSYQWILATKEVRNKNKTKWTNKSYHPTLSCLLDELV